MLVTAAFVRTQTERERLHVDLRFARAVWLRHLQSQQKGNLMNAHPIRRAAVAAVVVAASAGASFQSEAATPAGTIVFSRSQQDADANDRNRSLWLLDVGTGQARPLTTATDRVFDMTATWAPDGTALVFDRGSTRVRPDARHALEFMTPDASRPRTLLHGIGDFSKPAWGPSNRIAFVSKDRAGECVAIVDATGRNKRTLFCGGADTTFARPQWSLDGKALFVAGTLPEGRLEPIFHALAYRIDVATAKTTLMSDIIMGEPLELTFSPDGTRGVYADIVANDMTLVDFRNGSLTTLPRGHAPSWSHDGKRIAFTGEIYETGAEFRYYEPLYVMNADGTRVRRITDSRVNNHAYTAAQWSKDNVHLLMNRRTYSDVSLTRANYALRIVDVDTRALLQLPAGYAEPGGWYER